MSTQTPYTKKLHNTKEIRLVCVSAGQWHDPIRCRLIRRGLDNAVGQLSYRALSYVWGCSSVTDTIALQELPFQITLNLSCALRHLRRVDEEILLWVDAICINQRDHKERGLQVSIMQLIYKNAEQVVVFMGDGRSHRVNRSHLRKPHVSRMTTLHGRVRKRRLLSDTWSACDSSRPRKLVSSLPAATCAMGLISHFSDQETVEEGCVELMKLDKKNRCDLFEHFRAFVTCPWWTRIWVVQEIAVSTVVTIHYGTISLPWETLVATANVWSLPKTSQVASSVGIEPENLKVFALFANQLTGLEQARRKWHAEGGTDLVRLLQEFSDRQASDDRDKVFGLLSLAKQGQQYMKPNYFFDLFDTYRATALSLIGNGGSLACWAGDQKRKFNIGLPSWIPDWSTAVDTGDKRRMDMFEKYSANNGWTLRVIANEKEYWTIVEDQMELLVNSPAGKSARLPASLKPFVLDYIDLLKQRIESMLRLSFQVCLGIVFLPSMNRLAWDTQRGITLESTLGRLKWCEQHEILPRSGMSLLQEWIHDLEQRQNTYQETSGGLVYLSELLGPGNEASFDTRIRQHLQKLGAAIENEDMDMEQRMVDAQGSICDIESAVKIPEIGEREGITTAIKRLIHQCWRLSSLCMATDNAISPSNLFQVSYSLRGTAYWLTNFQFERTAPKEWHEAFESCWTFMEESKLILPMQMVVVDSVTDCGPRQFGWTDTKSALTTVVSWLYLSGPVIASGATAEPGEVPVQLNHARICQFAKTIVGGMCRRGGSYQKVDETPLGPLEDWLRQCLMIEMGKLGWELSELDTSGDAFVTLEDSVRTPAAARFGSRWSGNAHHGDPIVPRREWMRRPLDFKGFAPPPSPFFEDIQLATDGRVFFLTGNGSMGLGPASMRTGDTIHVLPSGRAHFVLREKPTESVPPAQWMKNMKLEQYELIGDCYLYTNSALDSGIPTEEEPVVEGSLPFEILGARYLKSRGLPTRETILLV